MDASRRRTGFFIDDRVSTAESLVTLELRTAAAFVAACRSGGRTLFVPMPQPGRATRAEVLVAFSALETPVRLRGTVVWRRLAADGDAVPSGVGISITGADRRVARRTLETAQDAIERPFALQTPLLAALSMAGSGSGAR